ncbi:MAG: hypothetical protein GY723_18660 [bacterium]|nr:hypothetical protein [bacterium]MCP5070164.1 hypothetical protein [bacterium]
MTVHRYSRWDGTQREFSFDAKGALDALSELLMEGLDVDQALEWMRRGGFDLGGMNFRVMGAEELISELREQMQELLDRYRIDRSLEELERKLDDILDREERAQREARGLESQAMNEFMERRHREHESLSDAIEAFRSHTFVDREAGEEFRELLEELDRLRELEEFQREYGERFQGEEAADYQKAQEIRRQIQALQQMARNLAAGQLQEISLEELREFLAEDGLRSFVMLRGMEQALQDEGFLRAGQDGMELTPRAIRRIGAQALAAVYSKLRAGRSGSHQTMHRGIAEPRPDETRPWAFGDALDVHVVRTILNGVKRAVAEARPMTPVQLGVEDLEVRECDFSTQTTTILLLDMSWSMSWAGRFPAAKRVALALDHLIRTRFPRDDFFVVGFSTRARELPIRELPLARWDMGDPFTNLQDGLRVAERLIGQHPSPSPQILVITDGQPTAYFEGRELRVEWPTGFGGVSPQAVAETLKTVRRVTRRGITINTFMLDDAPELVGFVERMTEINKGRAFFTMPNQLGTFLTVDYLAEKRSRFR